MTVLLWSHAWIANPLTKVVNTVDRTAGYCNSTSAKPGYGVASNEPYCYSSQPAWSAYRCVRSRLGF